MTTPNDPGPIGTSRSGWIDPRLKPTTGDLVPTNDDAEWSDRYTALGVPRHPPHLVCHGACEGTGVVPVYLSEGDHRDLGHRAAVAVDEDDPALVEAWQQAESVRPSDDGWHFVECQDCAGTGIAGGPSERNHYRGRTAPEPNIEEADDDA